MPKLIIPKVLIGWTVVVVEDDFDSQQVARRMLEKAGATVYVAENGALGIDLINRVQPKFVLSDISMPVMDGWAMISHLNSERRTSDIPIIALTAFAMHGDRERAISAGFVNYLTKPLDPLKFISQLLGLLVELPQFQEQLQESYDMYLQSTAVN